MNLRLLNSTTTTAGVQFINIENVFTTDFNVYHLVGSGLVGNTSTASGVNLRWLDQSGSVHSTNLAPVQRCHRWLAGGHSSDEASPSPR